MKRERDVDPEAGTPPEAELVDEAGAPAAETDESFRRRREPVRVQRRRRATWLRSWRQGWKPLLGGGAALAAGIGIYALLFHTSWFVLEGSDQIAVIGAHHTDRAQVLGVFSSDLGREVFFIPLEARRQAIAALPWVKQATVLRLWPARVQVAIVERAPVAFARAGDQLRLVDASGVLLDSPNQSRYDFPVLTGLAGADAADSDAPRWVALRAAQMRQFAQLQRELSGGTGTLSQEFSEIDLSDPSDVTVRVGVPGGGGTVLIHFGDQNFAARYRLFLSQIAGWKQKYPNLVSLDLHYDGQAIVDPGTPPPAAPAPNSKPGAKARTAKPTHTRGGGPA